MCSFLVIIRCNPIAWAAYQNHLDEVLETTRLTFPGFCEIIVKALELDFGQFASLTAESAKDAELFKEFHACTQKGEFMETVQIELPPVLTQQIRQELSTDEVPSWVIAEAVQMWLQKRRDAQAEKRNALRALRQAGVIMASERQRTLAENIMASLSLESPHPRAGGRCAGEA